MRSESPKAEPEPPRPPRWREVDMDAPHLRSHEVESDEDNCSRPSSPDGGKVKDDEGRDKTHENLISKPQRQKVYLHRCAFNHNCSHHKNSVSKTMSAPFQCNIISGDSDKPREGRGVEREFFKIENTYEPHVSDIDYLRLVQNVHRIGTSPRCGRDKCTPEHKVILIQRGISHPEGVVVGRRSDEEKGELPVPLSSPSSHTKELSQGRLEEAYIEGHINQTRCPSEALHTPCGSSPTTLPSLSCRYSSSITPKSQTNIHDTANLLASLSHPFPQHASCQPLLVLSPSSSSSSSPSPSPSSPVSHRHSTGGSLPSVRPSHPPPSPSQRPSDAVPSSESTKEANNTNRSSEEITPSFRKYCRNFFLETLCPGVTEDEVRQVASAVECLEDRVYLYNAKSKMDYCYQLARKLCCIQEELHQMAKSGNREVPLLHEKEEAS